MAKEELEYEQEELHQLEKMYKADDITEETEQIVLKRAATPWTGPSSMLESAADSMHDQALKFAIPRQGRASEGGGPAEVARLGEEQGRAAAWPCRSSDWKWRSCGCSRTRPRRSSSDCWPTAS